MVKFRENSGINLRNKKIKKVLNGKFKKMLKKKIQYNIILTGRVK